MKINIHIHYSHFSFFKRISLKWDPADASIQPICLRLFVYFLFYFQYTCISSSTLPFDRHKKYQISILFPCLLIILPSDIFVTLHPLSYRQSPWCNCYRHRKWIRWYEFKSWMRLIAFHIALIPLGKVWIQLFSLLFSLLWVKSRAD